jgi:hypothetical protein
MLRIEEVDISRLVPYDKNPRFISERNLQKLMRSMEEDKNYLSNRPLLVNHINGKYIVYAGNQRLFAAKRLGWDKLPCIVESLSEEVMKSRMLKDNVNYGDWDFEMLSEDFNIEKLQEFSLSDDFIDEFEKFFEEESGKRSKYRNKYMKEIEEKYGNEQVVSSNASESNENSTDSIPTLPPIMIQVNPEEADRLVPINTHKTKNIIFPVYWERYDYIASSIREIQEEINAPDWETVLNYLIDVYKDKILGLSKNN